jgi:hypothetical protein
MNQRDRQLARVCVRNTPRRLKVLSVLRNVLVSTDLKNKAAVLPSRVRRNVKREVIGRVLLVRNVRREHIPKPVQPNVKFALRVNIPQQEQANVQFARRADHLTWAVRNVIFVHSVTVALIVQFVLRVVIRTVQHLNANFVPKEHTVHQMVRHFARIVRRVIQRPARGLHQKVLARNVPKDMQRKVPHVFLSIEPVQPVNIGIRIIVQHVVREHFLWRAHPNV